MRTLDVTSNGSINDFITTQYSRGFSEGYSNGPVVQEWRSNLHQRLDELQRKHPPDPGQTEFWDLGCGTGENLLKAFLTDSGNEATDWVGVERMSGRYRLAAEAVDRLLERANSPGRLGEALHARLGLEGVRAEATGSPPAAASSLPRGLAGKPARCAGTAAKGRLCVVEGDMMDIADFSHARVIFLNIDDPLQIVTHQLMAGTLQESVHPNTALVVSYPLDDSDQRGWEPEASGFGVLQDWSGSPEDRGTWYHSLYRRAPEAQR